MIAHVPLIKEIAGKLWIKTSVVITGLLLVFGLIDYLQKWQIVPFLLLFLSGLADFVFAHLVEGIVMLWLAALTLMALRRNGSPKPAAPVKDVVHLEGRVGALETTLMKVIREVGRGPDQLKMLEQRMNSSVDNIHRTIVDFEIADHLSKHQIGALSKMIDKLEMDKKRGWGIEDTLFEIRDYIKESGMPATYLAKLNKAISGCSDDLKQLKEEILKLAHEKLYRI